jgi:hypothetical protein
MIDLLALAATSLRSHRSIRDSLLGVFALFEIPTWLVREILTHVIGFARGVQAANSERRAGIRCRWNRADIIQAILLGTAIASGWTGSIAS